MSGKKRTALVSIVAAAALVALKLVTGVVTGSLGLVSAGVESSGDVVAAVLTFFAIRLAGKPADEQHQYGHARAENLTALAEAAILVAGGVFVVHEAYGRLRSGGAQGLTASWYVFAVIGTALAVDVSRTVTSLRSAKRFNSAALRSNAFHFGADFVGTAAVLVGMLFVHFGYERADAYAAIFISALIFVASGRLILENARSLMDMAPAGAHDTVETAIRGIVPAVELRRLRLREVAGAHFADVVVGAPATAALAETHALADRVETTVENALGGADVVVHVEPSSEGQTLTDRVLAAALAVPGVREAHNVTVFETVDGRALVSLHLKLPPSMPLEQGHAIALRVEEQIRAAAPAVDTVHTHLEPVDPELAARPLPVADDADLRALIAEVVREVARAEPRDLRLVATDRGTVGFLTLALPAGATISEAHATASAVEQAIHERVVEIRELVIHTEL